MLAIDVPSSKGPIHHVLAADLLPSKVVHVLWMLFLCHPLCGPVTFLIQSGPCLAQTAADPNESFYLTEIKPLLHEKCYSCHGALNQEADLRLETRALMLQGDVIVPGHPDESLLIQRIRASDDEQMPPVEHGTALTAVQISLVSRWIAAGAPAPAEPPPQAPDAHWAFQVPRLAMVDREVKEGSASDNPVDRLLNIQRSQLGLQPSPPAARTLLIRRLYLDLVGLPPSPEALQDQRPLDQIVDDLLARPQYGERWGRHLMDIWRYSEWYGLGQQLRYSQKHIWHWRDWIIRSLNEDKGYDQMIREMLAADEMAPEDPEAIAATGFLARNYYLFNRTTWLDSTIEHTGKAFLGLTFNCAKCHDHKYDPISQRDYYRMRALFEPHQVRLDAVPGVPNLEKDGIPRVFDDHVDLPTFIHLRGDPKQPDRESPVSPGFPEILSEFAPSIASVNLPLSAYAPGTRDYVQQAALDYAQTALANAEGDHQKALKRVQQLKRIQAEIGSEQPDDSASDKAPVTLIRETFDQLDEDRWSIVGDGWKLSDGALVMNTATRDRHMARLKMDLPHDFQVECLFTTTGGTTYRSVTLRFDESEDGKDSSAVYTSAHAPGPKVQVTYQRQGKSVYPPEGRKAIPIKIGQAYKLGFAVRGRLVNVFLDDEFVLAYVLPDRRAGFFSLSGFDATVSFDELTIRTLPKEQPLKQTGASTPDAEESPEQRLKRAELALNVAKAELESRQATIAADRVRFAGPVNSAANRPSAIHAAAKAAAAQLNAEIAQAELTIQTAGTDSKSVKAALKKREALQKRLSELDESDPVYRSLRGSKKALESPADKEPDYPPVYSPVSTGRRSALAHWITNEKNPLTARVIVNHVWMRHFGTPLVDTVFDFGLRCDRPLQADLLDHLAADLMRSHWSLKQLHRTIVTSRAYQMQSDPINGDEGRSGDADNRSYWRANGKRMESQLVRDSLLSLAGQLDPTLGGPSASPNSSSKRRGLYLQHSRDQQDQFLSQFDDADILQCYRRSESIVPQQALALSNSRFAIEMSNAIAEQIVDSFRSGSNGGKADPTESERQFIEAAFLLLLCRPVTTEEFDECSRFMHQMEELESTANLTRQERRKRLQQRLILALVNHNDFITIR